MRVRVLYEYHKRGGIIVPAGEYDEADPALYGLASYLVENGHAEVVEEKPKSDPKKGEPKK